MLTVVVDRAIIQAEEYPVLKFFNEFICMFRVAKRDRPGILRRKGFDSD